MARELGLNPKTFGGLANHRQEPWKLPLPQFIEEIYLKRFGVPRPVEVLSLEDLVSRQNAKKEQTRIAKLARRKGTQAEPTEGTRGEITSGRTRGLVLSRPLDLRGAAIPPAGYSGR